MFVRSLVCLHVHVRPCGLACVYVKASEVSKGPNITQIKNVHPLIHGLTVCPSFLRAAARVCVFVRLRGRRRGPAAGVGGVSVGGERKKKLQQPGDKYLHSSKHRRTVLCPPLFIQRERVKEGKSWKRPESCAFLCLCVVTFAFSSKHS